jgi:threonine/homoserine/homoserine lactone efflux protein
MSFEQAQAFVVFALVAAVTPGPSNVMLAATGANVGALRGLPCLFGVGAGMGLMMSVVAFGLGALVLGSPLVAGALKWCGAGFLLWLSWRIASAGKSDSPYGGPPIGFLGAASFQWMSPKSWLVCTSAASTYLQAESGTAFTQSVLLGGLFIAAAIPSGFVWLAAGVALQRVLDSPVRLRTFNIAMAILLAGSVVLFVAG